MGGGRSAVLALAWVSMLLPGCASPGSGSGASLWQPADPPTLLVANHSGYQVAVYVGRVRIGTATRGTTCLRVPRSLGELELSFAAARGTRHSAPLAFLEESRHWRVELKPGVTIKYDLLSLEPARASCERRSY